MVFNVDDEAVVVGSVEAGRPIPLEDSEDVDCEGPSFAPPYFGRKRLNSYFAAGG